MQKRAFTDTLPLKQREQQSPRMQTVVGTGSQDQILPLCFYFRFLKKGVPTLQACGVHLFAISTVRLFCHPHCLWLGPGPRYCLPTGPLFPPLGPPTLLLPTITTVISLWLCFCKCDSWASITWELQTLRTHILCQQGPSMKTESFINLSREIVYL